MKQCDCYGFAPCRNREHAIKDCEKARDAADERGEELTGVRCVRQGVYRVGEQYICIACVDEKDVRS